MTLSPMPNDSAPDQIWAIEDWWAVLIGLSAVAAAAVAFRRGDSLEFFAVTPRAWSGLTELATQLRQDAFRYALMGGITLVLLTLAAAAMRQRPLRFAAGFAVMYALSVLIMSLTAWEDARRFYLEPPIIALLAGMLIANATTLPKWMQAGFRAEFFIKIAVVLLGASLSVGVFLSAGPVAILQAAIASVVTFAAIFLIARFLGLDRRLAAMLAGGGSVCGVSAVIAIAAAVRARREDVSIATTIVVGWALVMIVLLPLLARAWYLTAGVGGAWIGTSEFADAAGFAAAQTFSTFVRVGGLTGSPDQALTSYTLVKVIGRDMWIGVWAASLSLVAVTQWEPPEGQKVDLSQIWRRFPKFILGFALASLLISVTAGSADLESIVRMRLIAPIEVLRNWAFTFSFLSIGASMRLRGLAPVGGDALIAFSAGVVVNLVLGFFLSAVVFESYWSAIGR